MIILFLLLDKKFSIKKNTSNENVNMCLSLIVNAYSRSVRRRKEKAFEGQSIKKYRKENVAWDFG